MCVASVVVVVVVLCNTGGSDRFQQLPQRSTRAVSSTTAFPSGTCMHDVETGPVKDGRPGCMYAGMDKTQH